MAGAIVFNVKSRSGRPLGTFNVAGTTTVGQFKALFKDAPKAGGYAPERQRFTIESGPNKDKVLKPDEAPLSSFTQEGEETLVFKDLGIQIGYRTVFYVEYFGPILTHALCYYFPQLFYGQQVVHTDVQRLAFYCVLFHYIKRELETMFVHRFSNDTMPIKNIFKNCSHYWLLCGIFISYFLYHPLYTAPAIAVSYLYVFVALFVIFELLNLHTHIILMNLRPPGTRERRIPKGNLFARVCCANYTWELAAWLVFCIFTQTLTGYLFFVVSFAQIALWSIKKHKQYIKDFGAEYKQLRRNILIPFVW